MVLYIFPCFLFRKSFRFACISVTIGKIYIKESNSNSLLSFETYWIIWKEKKAIVLEEIKCFLGGKKALLFLTLNRKSMEFPDFSEGTEWRWKTSFVALLGNIKRKLQKKEHWEPFQASSLVLRLWRKTTQLGPFLAMQLREMYLPFWTSVSPSVNGNKREIISLCGYEN